MQIDRKQLNNLLKLNDKQLQMIFIKIAKDSGLDPSQFNINLQNVQSIRNAIQNASDDDLAKIAEQYEASKKRR